MNKNDKVTLIIHEFYESSLRQARIEIYIVDENQDADAEMLKLVKETGRQFKTDPYNGFYRHYGTDDRCLESFWANKWAKAPYYLVQDYAGVEGDCPEIIPIMQDVTTLNDEDDWYGIRPHVQKFLEDADILDAPVSLSLYAPTHGLDNMFAELWETIMVVQHSCLDILRWYYVKPKQLH